MNVGRNEIWDEFRWEEFLRRQEKRLDTYLEIFYKFGGDIAGQTLIAKALGLSEHFDFGSGFGEEDPYLLEFDEELDGESWKQFTGYEEYDDHRAGLERVPAFRVAHDYALSVNDFVDVLSPNMREDSTVVEFLGQALLAPARVADGYALGTELDLIGGNIAHCKRGLAASNKAVKALRQLRARGLVRELSYRGLVQGAVEARNAIAVHVVDLRERLQSSLP